MEVLGLSEIYETVPWSHQPLYLPPVLFYREEFINLLQLFSVYLFLVQSSQGSVRLCRKQGKPVPAPEALRDWLYTLPSYRTFAYSALHWSWTHPCCWFRSKPSRSEFRRYLCGSSTLRLSPLACTIKRNYKFTCCWAGCAACQHCLTASPAAHVPSCDQGYALICLCAHIDYFDLKSYGNAARAGNPMSPACSSLLK